ncbi:Hsp90 co-chaperone Cdc37 [Holothuria leucospilota]|uniref:Hsp90 chaperone protein kinase-targeting subunit n=1 Tax=Holothuria leucospilota TaxID=206669 RepID=A0A9Q1BSJ7_HOLLE|nr:Hsp90 co-chaperone Cdc37 [Holothuria leucospilota]
MKKAEEEKQELEKGTSETRDKLKETRNQLEQLKKEGAREEKIAEVTAELKKLEDDFEKWKEKEEELAKKERLTPWNVDTLSQDGFQKTMINKYEEKEENLTEEEEMDRQKKFVEKYEKEIKKFGMYKRLDDSQQFLLAHTHLACEFTANYLVIWCIDLEEEGKSSLMAQVAHQTITMQFLLELAKNLKEDPRACIRPFFTKMKKAEEQYQTAFDDELAAFIGRVKERAEVRKERARELAEEQAKKEEEERQARLGPGGLDPVEVMESLPPALQKCFETQDIPLLQETLKTMSLKEAKYHMDRCAKSGLWVPAPSAKEALERDEEDEEDEEEEEVYEDALDK